MPLGAAPREIIVQLRQRTKQRWAHVQENTRRCFGMDCIVLLGETKALMVAEVYSLPSPTVMQSFSKSHLHLPSSHAELHAHWRHWATAWQKLILKHGFLLQLPWKKPLHLQGRRSPNNLLVLFLLLLLQLFKKLFFFLLSLLIFVGLELCILLLLILMWRMLSLSKIHSFSQVLSGYWSSAVYTQLHVHTQRDTCSFTGDDYAVISIRLCNHLLFVYTHRTKYTITVTWLKTLLSQILNFYSCTLWHQIGEVAENSKTWISLVKEYRKKISLSFSISQRSKK